MKSSRTIPTVVATLLAGGALVGVSGTARADGPNLLDEGFYASLGVYSVSSDTNVRLDGKTAGGGKLDGTPINWERTFGDDTATRFRFDGFWRWSEKSKVRLIWFNASRDDTKTINREIEWGGETFPVDAKLKGKLSFNIVELAYEYAFMRRDNFELSGTFGLHYAGFKANLSANVNTTEGGVSTEIDKRGSVGLPLPVIGARAMWHIGGDFWLDATAQYFALSIQEYDGNLSDLRAAVVWQPTKWAGVGLGFDRFNVDVDVDKDKFQGNLNWTYQGPQLFYSVSF